MARIPLDHKRTRLVRLGEAYSRRKYGAVLEPGLVAMHNPRVLVTMMLNESGAGRWKALPETLKALAVMASSAEIGCSWCMDFGYWESHHAGVPTAKLRDIPDWRNSEVYTATERRVLEYSGAMTRTPPEVTDEMVEALRRELSDKQLVELTHLVALENQRSRVNAAMGLTGQGFKATCEVAG
ncbi:MAG: carboxymuconolactone decarboxylase family protein [Nocardioidaceae bacterium]